MSEEHSMESMTDQMYFYSKGRRSDRFDLGLGAGRWGEETEPAGVRQSGTRAAVCGPRQLEPGRLGGGSGPLELAWFWNGRVKLKYNDRLLYTSDAADEEDSVRLRTSPLLMKKTRTSPL